MSNEAVPNICFTDNALDLTLLLRRVHESVTPRTSVPIDSSQVKPNTSYIYLYLLNSRAIIRELVSIPSIS